MMLDVGASVTKNQRMENARTGFLCRSRQARLNNTSSNNAENTTLGSRNLSDRLKSYDKLKPAGSTTNPKYRTITRSSVRKKENKLTLKKLDPIKFVELQTKP